MANSNDYNSSQDHIQCGFYQLSSNGKFVQPSAAICLTAFESNSIVKKWSITDDSKNIKFQKYKFVVWIRVNLNC